MSGTLVARKAPKTDRWPWSLKAPVRDKLNDKFGGYMDSGAIGYLEGLRDCTEGDAKKTLQEMIDALADGFEIEFKVEY